MKLAFVFFLFMAMPLALGAKSSSLLKEVELHYRSAQSVKMDVAKTLKLRLLDQEKHSQGHIQIKRGGLIRWETEEPTHSMVLADGKAIWFVDYVGGEDENPNIVKASNPKSQPHAVVAFLLGQGRISDDFSVIKEKTSDGHHTLLELKPKKDGDQIKWLNMSVNKDKNEIETISFEDAVGNETELKFKEIKFNSDIDSKVFKFVPPKGADITVLR